MKRTVREIKKALPNLEINEKIEVLADELDRVQDLKKLFKSDSGKYLVAVLTANCAKALRKLHEAIQDKPDLPTLMGIIATYGANLDLLAEMQDITVEEEIQRQLDEAVKEMGEDPTQV